MTRGTPIAGGTLAFVHDYGPFGPEQWDRAVALTPVAVATQAAADLAPLILDDLVDRRALVVDPQRDLLRWQLAWLDRLATRSLVPPDVVATAFALLKEPVDSVIYWSRMLAAAVDAVRPDRVTYVGPAMAEATTGTGGRGSYGGFRSATPDGEPTLAEQLLPGICVARGVGYQAELWPADAGGAGEWLRSPWSARVPRIRDRLALYRNFGQLGRPVRSAEATLMLWTGGYGARLVAEEVRGRGNGLLVLERDRNVARIRDGSSPTLSTLLTLVPPPVMLPAPLEPAVREWLDELDEWTEVSTSGDVLEGRLGAFLQGTCPTIDAFSRQIGPLLVDRGVNRIVAANPYTAAEFGALVAGGRAGVEQELVQHGDHAYPYDFWLVQETQSFDTLAVSDPTVPGDLREAAAALGCHVPEFRSWAPRIEQLRRSTGRGGQVQQNLVCYLPTHYAGDSVIISGAGCDDGWMTRWQLRLLAIMSDYPDLTFLWKSLPGGAQGASDPFASLIGEMANVEYSTEPFRNYLGRVGALVTDFLSTGLYEALEFDVPSLAVTFSRCENIRPSARERLRDVLVSCEGVEDADAQVRRFLDSRVVA